MPCRFKRFTLKLRTKLSQNSFFPFFSLLFLKKTHFISIFKHLAGATCGYYNISALLERVCCKEKQKTRLPNMPTF